MQRQIILASTSVYRRQLLERLQLPFSVARPDVDESALPAESAAQTAERLALAKARAVAERFADALVIGSDQVASQGQSRFGKPGTPERAMAQLRQMSGRSICFHTALCLYDSRTGQHALETVATEVGFRHLTEDEIVRYMEREQPLDCAGSAKAEALGITLLDFIRGDDPNALIGLPLIALCRMLRAAGVPLP